MDEKEFTTDLQVIQNLRITCKAIVFRIDPILVCKYICV